MSRGGRWAAGGFAAVFGSPLYAAADLGQRLLWDAGQPTFFSPVTIHLQEGPVGESAAVLEADRSQFLDRRRTALPRASASALPLSRTRDLRPGKRLLFIEDRIPAPPQGCGFPRSFTILRTLAELGYILDEGQFEKVYERFLKVADQKKTVDTRDLEAIVADEVDLWYDTRLCQCVVDGDRITHLIVENKDGRGALACRAMTSARRSAKGTTTSHGARAWRYA